MFDIWQEIYGTIKRNKLRTFLTGFAVAWGIFMLIVLLGAGNGIIHAFEQSSSERALNSIRIFPGWTSKPYAGLKEGRRVRLENNDLEATSGLCNQCRCYRAAEQCKRQFWAGVCEYLLDGSTPQLYGGRDGENC